MKCSNSTNILQKINMLNICRVGEHKTYDHVFTSNYTNYTKHISDEFSCNYAYKYAWIKVEIKQMGILLKDFWPLVTNTPAHYL